MNKSFNFILSLSALLILIIFTYSEFILFVSSHSNIFGSLTQSSHSSYFFTIFILFSTLVSFTFSSSIQSLMFFFESLFKSKGLQLTLVYSLQLLSSFAVLYILVYFSYLNPVNNKEISPESSLISSSQKVKLIQLGQSCPHLPHYIKEHFDSTRLYQVDFITIQNHCSDLQEKTIDEQYSKFIKNKSKYSEIESQVKNFFK